MHETSLPAAEAPVRVRVKICGLTCVSDAEAAIAAGADALGFNTWRGSKRFLDLAEAAPWIRQLPGFVTRVALCINEPWEELRRIAALSFVDALQLHGDESRATCADLAGTGISLIRAVRLGAESDLVGLDQWATRQLLVDAAVPGAFGGTGARADWALAAQAVRNFPRLAVTLAGGLDPENVAEAVRTVRPYAVDVASGVESAPGRKDAAKMRDFVQAVRSTG